MCEGQIPDDWGIARVKPIHKSGRKNCIKNYRPISLTCTACKLLEHIIHSHITQFIDQHNILTKHQHEFRKGHSTCTQLVETIHDFALTINNGKQTDVIFMDFKKAFDKVSHKKLLFKLSKIINNHQLLNWLTAYITNRKQFVVFNGETSEDVSVDSGVPQGSVLGPLLFLLFVNDIVCNIPVKIRLYADDCVIYTEVNSVADQILLNNTLNKIALWCDKWQMCINFDKTVFMRITHRKSPLAYTYSANNNFLHEVYQYKYLGLWISNTLNWTQHIDYVVRNANCKLFYLRRALKFSTHDVRITAYKALILPSLDYAAIFWDPFTRTNINKLETIQKKGVRFIYNSYGRTSVSTLLSRASLPPIAERNRLARLKFLYQIVKSHYKLDISNIITFSSGYATRQRHQMTITPHRSRNNTFKYSFFPRTITEWNQLTSTQVQQPSLTLFTSSLT